MRKKRTPENPLLCMKTWSSTISNAWQAFNLSPETKAEIAGESRHIELSLEALRVERETAIRLRDEGRINDEVLRRIERELDLSESRIAYS